jgi:DNA repair exonuclease SbcCD nuclease subunit
LDTWWGHFEFKDFIVTGYNVKMPTGPDPRDFKGPKNIFSGHFHKRQTAGNITYIGNTFPTNFGDAGDTDRGMVVYDHKTHKLEYKNWDNCPQYVKAPLTSLLDGSIVLPPNARVKCIVDVPISFEESNYIKDTYVGNFDLREFAMEESGELDEALTSTRIVGTAASMGETVDELVIKMLSAIKSDHINKDILIDLYKGLPT